MLLSCQAQKYGKDVVSVKTFGAKGDGITDDRAAIQQAFQLGKTVVFPKGTYLIESKTRSIACLLITEQNAPSHIIFEEGAMLLHSADMPRDYIKPAIFFLLAEKGDIPPILIEGLHVDGNRSQHALESKALQTYEISGFNIQKVMLKNAVVENTGGTGISTQALRNEFYNIRTTNCGKHGIGVSNTTNHGQLHYFYLDGHVSTDDGAYAIDFSGLWDDKNPKKALAIDQWEGKAKNVRAIRPGYGIKTAGYWNLELENIYIEDSRNNGFFLSKDAPGKTITARNMQIVGAANNGLSLSGESTFVGENISLIGCRVGLLIKRTDVSIDSLTIDGQYKNVAGIRMGGSNVELRNFVIKNNAKSDPYPVWVNGKNVVLENGLFLNNASLYEMAIKEQAGEVRLENLSFVSNFGYKKAAIMQAQKNGTTTLINSDFSQFKGRVVAGKKEKLQIVSSSKHRE